VTITQSGMLTLINPVERSTTVPIGCLRPSSTDSGVRPTRFEAVISRNGNRLQRYEGVLHLLPKGHAFDGELVVLDDAGRPQFNELLFGRRRPTYVAFDLLMTDGVDLRPLALRERKARLARIGEGAEGWIAPHQRCRWRGAGALPGRHRRGLAGHRCQAFGRRLPPEARAVAQGSQSGLFAASWVGRMVSRARAALMKKSVILESKLAQAARHVAEGACSIREQPGNLRGRPAGDSKEENS
jgi:hypothetical protein